MRVIFYQIKSNQIKLQKIIESALFHFTNNEKFLLIAPDEVAVNFVDDLLWKSPTDSFIPHFTSSTQLNEKIVITSKRENLNNSKNIFNLCPSPIMFDNVSIIYEFEDFTSPVKLQLSRKKYESYKERKFFIESKLS